MKTHIQACASIIIKILIGLLFITFPLGQVVRWEFFNSQLVIRPNDLIALILGGIGLFKMNGPLKKPLLLWFAAMGVSLLVNFQSYTLEQLVISASYAVRFALYSGLYFIFKDFKINSKYLVYVCLVVAFLGFAQYWLVPDTRFLKDLGWDDHYYRLLSTFLDPGFTGAILLLGLLLASSRVSGILYVAMSLTYSRATFLMFIVAYGVIALYKKSVKTFVIACIVMALTLIFLPRTFGEGTKLTRETSTWGRVNNWKQTIEVWQKYPVFGLGFNGYRYLTNAPVISHAGAGADSSLLLILATTGLAGFVSFLYLLKTMWHMNRNVIFRASFAAIIIGSFFNNTLLYPFVMEWLWIILAITENT